MSSPISGLPVADTPLNLVDLITIVQGGVTKQATIGDIPDADIITNANGTAVRWESGLQICYFTIGVESVAVTTAAGELFRSGDIDWTFPAAFNSPPPGRIFFPQRAPENLWGSIAGSTATAAVARIFNPVSFTASVRNNWVAIGTWK